MIRGEGGGAGGRREHLLPLRAQPATTCSHVCCARLPIEAGWPLGTTHWGQLDAHRCHTLLVGALGGLSSTPPRGSYRPEVVGSAWEWAGGVPSFPPPPHQQSDQDLTDPFHSVRTTGPGLRLGPSAAKCPNPILGSRPSGLLPWAMA